MSNVNNFEAILKAINESNCVVKDDHGNGQYLYAAGVANLERNGKCRPVLLLRNTAYFSLNLVYLGDKGEARLSRDSVGGVVKMMNGVTLEEGIVNYNEEQVENMFTASFLRDVYLAVDNKLVASDLVTEEQVVELVERNYAFNKTTDTYRASEN